ncbi:hypothetical protein OCL06_14795 [Alteromonas sp. ASW11-19]|uniref:Phage holin family protein n=1 Tax=Alteromonas salexigens TaxID=2982530 RepID=A0ABT2VRB3_9ALTE|nr:hypothetical protein [Alteromonas salexigens]MCU7555856.1 hypothetical protein [Alteromonas salexigens]
MTQLIQPDFRQASFSPETENMYCPTSSTGRADACRAEKTPEDDTTVSDTIQAFKDTYAQKYDEMLALADVVAAESALVKKSAVVTGLSAGAAAVLGCFCWLIVNITLAIACYQAGIHYLLITTGLLLINGGLGVFAVKVARDAYKHMSLMPVFNSLMGQIPNGKEERGEAK